MTETKSAAILIEIRRELLGCFRYIHLHDAELLYTVATGQTGWVCVIGHPEHGSYEWVARSEPEFVGQTDRFYDHSDLGYGSSAYALRDGLTANLE